MTKYAVAEAQLLSFLICALGGDELSPSRSGRFTPQGIVPNVMDR